MAATPVDILTMSDEEISKLSAPPEVMVAEEKKEEPAATEETKTEEAPVVEETPKVEEEKKPEETPAEKKEEPAADPTDAEVVAKATKLIDPATKGPDAKSAPKVEEKPAEVPAKKAEETPASTGSVDYKGAYEKIMAPFKANGKTIQLESVDEAIQLMQMGANYTKKMQALQPQKKLLMMLENNGLLDEGKISFLIDLNAGNPEAIKQLLKNTKIDPLEMDLTKVDYRGKSHSVTDQEVSLASAIEDLNARDGGKETLQSVNEWDKASKQALWENPEVLSVIHTQRENGIYEKITTEMERRKTLGRLPPGVQFLQAYKLVGDELAAAGAFQSLPSKTSPAAATGQKPAAGTPAATTATTVTRPAKTPATKATDNRVKAAAPSRTSPQAAQPKLNYLAMSDEEFLKLPGNKY